MKTGRFQTAGARMGVLGVLFILGTFAVLAPAWVAADAPVTVTVDGQWTNAVGTNGDPACLVYRVSEGEHQVRYGDDTWPSDGVCPGDSDLQSGLGFAGAGEVPFQTDAPFKLGDFNHYNRSIWANSTLQTVDLAVTLGLGDSSVTLYYTVALNETDNVQCLPEASVCEDTADVVTAIPNQTFVIGNMEYTLQILGFGDPNSTTDTITTDENAITRTGLVGQFVIIGPAPMMVDPSPPISGVPVLIVMGLGLAILGGVLWYGKRPALLPRV